METLFALLFTIVSVVFIITVQQVTCSISIEGQINSQSDEELNFFIAPIEHKRLLSKENCQVDTGCQLSMTHTNKTGTKYHLHITDIKPEYTGMLAVCVTSNTFSTNLPFQTVQSEKCDDSSLTLVSPSATSSTGNFNISFYTWFMDHINYQSMTVNNFTQVLIPKYSTEDDYTLYLFGAVTFNSADRSSPDCHMYHNSETYKMTEYNEINKKIKQFYSTVRITDSTQGGQYSFNCTMSTSDTSVPGNTKGKVISLKVVQIPCIIMDKFHYKTINGNIVGSISLVIGSETMINSTSMITIEPMYSSSMNNNTHYTLQHKYSASLFNHYEIIFSSKNIYSMTGKYEIKVKLLTGETLTEEFNVGTVAPAPIASKITGGPQVVATPGEARLVNGSTATFECTVTSTESIEVSWKKQDGRLNSNTAVDRLSSAQQNTRVLRLRISSLTFADTGWYTCTAQTSNQNITQHVNLLVLPPGSPYLDPNYRDPTEGPPKTPTNSTGTFHEILKLLKTHYMIIGGVGGGIVSGVVTFTVLVIGYHICCKKSLKKNDEEDNNESDNSSSKETETKKSTNRKQSSSTRKTNKGDELSRNKPQKSGGGERRRQDRRGSTSKTNNNKKKKLAEKRRLTIQSSNSSSE